MESEDVRDQITGSGFFPKRACGRTEDRAWHVMAILKTLAQSGWMYCRPSPAFGAWGLSGLSLEAPGCREFEYSCLENPMDGGAWWAAVHGVAKSQTQLSDFTLTFHFHALEKEMATHSSVLAWRIPGTGEPGGLTSVGSHRGGHD